MGHTPGPWEIVATKWYEYGGIAHKSELGYLPVICDLVPAQMRDYGENAVALDGETIEANARLICAAPELLAACKEIVNYYQTMSGNENAPVADKYWLKGAIMARAAIGKAEGKQ